MRNKSSNGLSYKDTIKDLLPSPQPNPCPPISYLIGHLRGIALRLVSVEDNDYLLDKPHINMVLCAT